MTLEARLAITNSTTFPVYKKLALKNAWAGLLVKRTTQAHTHQKDTERLPRVSPPK